MYMYMCVWGGGRPGRHRETGYPASDPPAGFLFGCKGFSYLSSSTGGDGASRPGPFRKHSRRECSLGAPFVWRLNTRPRHVPFSDQHGCSLRPAAAPALRLPAPVLSLPVTHFRVSAPAPLVERGADPQSPWRRICRGKCRADPQEISPHPALPQRAPLHAPNFAFPSLLILLDPCFLFSILLAPFPTPLFHRRPQSHFRRSRGQCPREPCSNGPPEMRSTIIEKYSFY